MDVLSVTANDGFKTEGGAFCFMSVSIFTKPTLTGLTVIGLIFSL